MCGCKLVNPDENYLVRGNYCSPCNSSCTGASMRKFLSAQDKKNKKKKSKKSLAEIILKEV